MIMNKSIWVISDNTKYDSQHTLQLVSKANKLAEKKNTDISVICIGKYDESAFERLIEFGASNVIFCENSISDEAIHTDIIESLIKEKKPILIIFPATQFAKVVSATLSSRFGAGLTADCIDITIDTDESFVFSRAAINNSVIARIKCIRSEFEMCTVKQNVFPLLKSTFEKKGFIEKFDFPINKPSTFTLIDIIKKSIRKNDSTIMNTTKIVFAVGRGIKNKDTLELLKKVAKKYNAEIVGTRAAVEAGLIEKSRQVGQSGISICPNIYVGFGISGASQHIVGIKNSKIIIAVNSDENAPIFNYADYSILDDVNAVLKELDSMVQ